MKTLLIPTDFSETSDAAVEFGLQLAQKHGYDVILHHSVDFVNTYDGMYMDVPNVRSFTDEILDDGEVKLHNLLKRCKKDHIHVTKSHTVGNFITDLKKIVENQNVDLIVMGTKGATGLQEFFVGSNTEKVVRLIDCPVISIPTETKLHSIRKIMVPIDLRELRPGFLKQISFFQQLFSASVEFVWVMTPHSIENTDVVTEEMNNILSKYEIASSSFTIIRDVFPDDGILKYAKESETDIIAMSTHARRGLAHLFAGSLTEDVLNHLRIPLWSFKIDDKDEIIDLEEFQDINQMPKLR